MAPIHHSGRVRDGSPRHRRAGRHRPAPSQPRSRPRPTSINSSPVAACRARACATAPCRRLGSLPPCWHPPATVDAAPPAPDERLEPCSPDAAILLRRLIDGQMGDVLPEALDRLRRAPTAPPFRPAPRRAQHPRRRAARGPRARPRRAWPLAQPVQQGVVVGGADSRFDHWRPPAGCGDDLAGGCRRSTRRSAAPPARHRCTEGSRVARRRLEARESRTTRRTTRHPRSRPLPRRRATPRTGA